MDYLIDNHFLSFLSFIKEEERLHLKDVFLYDKENYQVSFLNPFTPIDYDEEKGYEKLQELGREPSLLNTLHEAFLSEDPERLFHLHGFYHYYKENGSGVLHDYGHPMVYPVIAMRKKVLRERHKFLGLLRFRRLKGDIYYADFEPTYDILSLLTGHFKQRLTGLSFMIHDKKREKAFLYHEGKEAFSPLSKDTPLEVEDFSFENLWRIYHKHISIKERENKKLQRQFVPKKYWKYLPEF